MLKRKSGNTFFTSPTKCVKPAPLKPKYQQQPLTFHKKPSHLKTQEKFSLHSQVSGILLSYLKDYKSRSKSYTSTLKSEKFLLIQGPAGCGKTFLVRDLASTLNLELLEINFSLSKSKASILRTIEQAASIFALETNGKTGSLIFIDDVDVLYELDDALFEGINSLMKNLKAPVFMTCTVIPKCLETSEHVKVYQLNSFKGFQEKSFVLVKEMCSDLKMVFPDNIIKNVISSTRGDLRKIVSLLGLNTLNCFDWLFGLEFKVLDESTVQLTEIENNLELLYENYEKTQETQMVSCEFLDNLAQIDLLFTKKDSIEHSFRAFSYVSSLEKIHKKHQNFVDFRMEKKKITSGLQIREKFQHFSSLEDHISFLSVLSTLPCTQHPLAMTWQVKMNLSYLEVFISC